MAKPLVDFFPRLIPFVPGCSEPMAEQALLDSAIAFCEKTLAWRYTPDLVQTVADVGTYDFDLPSNSEFSRVIHLKINDQLLASVVTEKQPLRNADPAQPQYYFVTQNESETLLNLYPTPDDVYDLTMSIALVPTRSARYVDDDLFTYWIDAIIAGAIYRLMIVPGQTFSDPANAMFHGRRAENLMTSARIEGNMGRVVGSMDTQPRPFVKPRPFAR